MFKFTVPKPRNIENFIDYTEKQAARYSVNFKRGSRKGSGSGYFSKAEYEILPGSISITVLKKPPMISEAKIKKYALDFVLEFIEKENNKLK